MPVIEIPTSLRTHTGGNRTVPVHGHTASEALSELVKKFPSLEGKIMTPDTRLVGFIRIFIDDDDVRDLDCMIKSDARIALMIAVAGG